MLDRGELYAPLHKGGNKAAQQAGTARKGIQMQR